MAVKAVRTVEILNERGLHARASAKFVKLASEFDAEVTVSRDEQKVDARSIMGLMMLAAGPGSSIDIAAEPTSATVFSVMCSRIQAMSATHLSVRGAFSSLIPRRCAALSRATCAVTGMMTSGSVMPFSARPRSRYTSMGLIRLSVPPKVTTPQTCSPG